MRARRAMVIKVDEMHMHVMTDDGEFRRLRTPRGPVPSAGDIITLPAFRGGRLHLAAAALIAVFVLAALLVPSPAFVATAHVEMEINPAVRMSLDADGYVGSVSGLNDDGERLASVIEIRMIPVEEMMDGILAGALELGFLSPDAENLVLIAVTAADGAGAPHVPDAAHLRSVAGEILQARGVPGAVAAANVPSETAQRAGETGLTLGREIIRQQVEETEHDMTLEAVRDMPMGQLVREAGPPVWAMFRVPPGRDVDTWTPPPGWSNAPDPSEDDPADQGEAPPRVAPPKVEPPGHIRPGGPGQSRGDGDPPDDFTPQWIRPHAY